MFLALPSRYWTLPSPLFKVITVKIFASVVFEKKQTLFCKLMEPILHSFHFLGPQIVFFGYNCPKPEQIPAKLELHCKWGTTGQWAIMQQFDRNRLIGCDKRRQNGFCFYVYAISNERRPFLHSRCTYFDHFKRDTDVNLASSAEMTCWVGRDTLTQHQHNVAKLTQRYCRRQNDRHQHQTATQHNSHAHVCYYLAVCQRTAYVFV